MMHISLRNPWLWVAFVLVIIVLFVSWQLWFIFYHYSASVPAPTIPRTTEQFGSGSTVRFVVMGDSTSIGQGSDYNDGIARQTALHIARHHHVLLTNVGVSGARVADVFKQLPAANASHPDLILLAIGANDVTHLTSFSSIRRDVTKLLSDLQAQNPNVQIVLTGSPAMGSVPRFAPPTQWLAAWRTRHINNVFSAVAAAHHVTLLPLADKTAATFKQDPSLFASDNFHPNARGYAVWQPVIDAGLPPQF